MQVWISPNCSTNKKRLMQTDPTLDEIFYAIIERKRQPTNSCHNIELSHSAWTRLCIILLDTITVDHIIWMSLLVYYYFFNQYAIPKPQEPLHNELRLPYTEAHTYFCPAKPLILVFVAWYYGWSTWKKAWYYPVPIINQWIKSLSPKSLILPRLNHQLKSLSRRSFILPLNHRSYIMHLLPSLTGSKNHTHKK
jgi:hypothetical protein